MTSRKTILTVLGVCTAIELTVFYLLASAGRDAFRAFISTPDTPEYVRVGLQIAIDATLPSTTRTLGYPLFLAAAYIIGGRAGWMYLVIGLQMALNLLLTFGCWRLLQQLAPEARTGFRLLATLVVFWAGLGMSLYLMTDFLAAFLFGVFLYGMLFWRGRRGVVATAVALALATLLRPTLTYLPLLLPVVAYLVSRVTSPVRARHVAVIAALALAATSVSVAYQYSRHRFLGPSPILITAIEETLYHSIVKHQVPPVDFPVFEARFEGDVARLAGRPFDILSPADRDTYAKQILFAELAARPSPIIINWIKNFVKYVFVPVESMPSRVVQARAGEERYVTYLRPLLTLLWLPLWTLSLMPPAASLTSGRSSYYLLTIVLLGYILGLSAICTGSGERIRFPLLSFMMPVAVWNASRLDEYVRRVAKARSVRGGDVAVARP